MSNPNTNTEIKIDYVSNVDIECNIDLLLKKAIEDENGSICDCVVGVNYGTEEVEGFLLANYVDGKVVVKLDTYQNFSDGQRNIDDLVVISISNIKTEQECSLGEVA